MRICVAILIVCLGIFAAVWCVWRVSSSTHSGGGSGWQSDIVYVSKGVEYRYFAEGSPVASPSTSDALVLDVDLTSPAVRLQVAADSPVRRRGGKVFGISHTVRDWCVMNRAIAGINGGFFGQTDADGINK